MSIYFLLSSKTDNIFRYLMTKRLGDGTFGEVMLAKKIDTGDRVAIKRCVVEWIQIIMPRLFKVFNHFSSFCTKFMLFDKT